jgi:hypothetical protein
MADLKTLIGSSLDLVYDFRAGDATTLLVIGVTAGAVIGAAYVTARAIREERRKRQNSDQQEESSRHLL